MLVTILKMKQRFRKKSEKNVLHFLQIKNGTERSPQLFFKEKPDLSYTVAASVINDLQKKKLLTTKSDSGKRNWKIDHRYIDFFSVFEISEIRKILDKSSSDQVEEHTYEPKNVPLEISYSYSLNKFDKD